MILRIPPWIEADTDTPVQGRALRCEEILAWRREENQGRLQLLWRAADALRREHVGDAVHLRGLIEISNSCIRQCGYCGLRAGHRDLERYRMNAAEIPACARQAAQFGYGRVVLQSGEDSVSGRTSSTRRSGSHPAPGRTSCRRGSRCPIPSRIRPGGTQPERSSAVRAPAGGLPN